MMILDTDHCIAVVGMAGRFPGADNLASFWRRLVAGDDSVTRFGTGPDGRTAAYGVVEGGDMFDAAFFGYSPREALMLDPQHRVFLECASAALENAGVDPKRHAGRIGTYGGCGDTGHFQTLLAHRDQLPGVSEWQLRLASGCDFLTSRVAYKLGLTGPAVTVQTACSTSLVAVHVACQALLAGDCDTALAGGVTVRVPHPLGEGEDGVVSPDGTCRPFDAAANGTVASDGVGVVVLKRLEDAIADHDHVHALLRGSAVTNDGTDKIGFTAPSIDGQASAVRAAHLLADVAPDAIDFVQAHGTGTPVGDPIEVRALSKAFGLSPEHAGRIRLGSVKSSIGHTDAAAGVVGLITTVLALTHEEIPGTLHFQAANPALDLGSGPFQVSATPQPWPRTARPRLAGVNSLGLGGTNVHVVVQEAPAAPDREPARRWQLLPFSARSAPALAQIRERLADHLATTDETVPLCDVAWTLQTGRTAHKHRGFVVAGDHPPAVAALRAPDPGGDIPATSRRRVAFLFPGHGGQHIQMACELYEHEPVFRVELDRCTAVTTPRLGVDLRDVLYPEPRDPAAVARARERLAPMAISQPALFCVEYALARLWQSWGVQPDVVLGHSLGAYVAATVAGVMSLSGALALVLERSRLLDSLPQGAMLAAAVAEEQLTPLLTGQVSLAAVNGPQQCVVTGPAAQIADLHQQLLERGIDARPLHISAAAHSMLVDTVAGEFEQRVAEIALTPPTVPWISDRTGAPVSDEAACDPAYWRAHLRNTVRFADALETLLAPGDRTVLEVGPGHTLSSLVRSHPAYQPGTPVVPSLPHAADPTDDAAFALRALGRLWASGVEVDWAALHLDGVPRRTPLPTYPFERQRMRLGGAWEPPAAPASVGIRPEENLPGSGHARAAEDLTLANTERAVADAFAEVLGMADVEGQDHFFELGGDSLTAGRLITKLRGTVGAELSIGQLFGSPTVTELAGLITRERSE
jgi:phthiocerol/phenolphthiocerol synthesis type-I polyketide synthase E